MDTQLKLLTRSILAGFMCAASTSNAQVVVADDFTGAAQTQPWTLLHGAQTSNFPCLTAGTGTAYVNSSGVTITPIPACTITNGGGHQYGGYGVTGANPLGNLWAGVADPVGNGALRFTDAIGNQASAIIYNSTFPSNLGISITFTAVSYDGKEHSGGLGSDGADGLSFFLLDASVSPSNIGSYGGSLGYSCSNSNSPYTGATGGYIGLGLDEYGNFLNGGDNTASGVTSTTSGSTQQQGSRIGLRGNGMVNWQQLNATYPSYYPSTLSTSQQATAVLDTCETGKLWNFSGSTPAWVGGCPYTTYAQLQAVSSSDYPNGLTTTKQNTAISDTCSGPYLWSYSGSTWVQTGTKYTSSSGTAISDYAPISFTSGSTTTYASSVLSVPIANESAGARTFATEYTYNLKITSAGLMSLSYITNASGATSQQIATGWSITATNGTAPSNYTFGFAASTGGGWNIHEITCFQAAPADDTDSSAGVNVVQTGSFRTNSQIYLAYYHSSDWWGQLTASTLLYNTATNVLSIASTANWDASCELTGDGTGTTLPNSKCNATGSTSDTAESSTVGGVGTRQILTYNGGGVPFEWSNLSTAQTTALNVSDTQGQSRLAFLRGSRTNEVSSNGSSGIFRARVSVLGDIIDSSPTWVGPPTLAYPSGATWTDLLYSSAVPPENSAATPYGQFGSNYASRMNVVYTGANDGMLHGFQAGYFSGTSLIGNTGSELIAYMPNAVVTSIHSSTASLDYSSPSYNHSYYVDAQPGDYDLFYGGAWHTWLVGGLGAGGNAVYALDITQPTNFLETNASSVVMGEWSPATANLGNNLGSTFGTPTVNRFHDGNWYIVFGNGYNAPNHNGGVFIGKVTSGTESGVSYTFLSLPASANGTAGNPNGIFSVYPADLDGDFIVDYIYAGDLYGNVWRWDVTSQTATNWSSTPTLIFSTPNSQPISTQVQAVFGANPGGLQRILIEFGTGEQIPTTTGTIYATGQQSIYGIWDGNMTSWNSIANSSAQFDTFPSAHTVVLADLETQTSSNVTYGTPPATTNIRTMTSHAVCWVDDGNCSTNTQYGWVYNFPLQSGQTATQASTAIDEQVIFNPTLQEGAFVVNTYIAGYTQSCLTTNPTGWTMAVNPATGGAFNQSFFINLANVPSSAIVSGVQLGGTGSASFIGSYLVTQTLNGGKLTNTNPPAGPGYRFNWTELR